MVCLWSETETTACLPSFCSFKSLIFSDSPKFSQVQVSARLMYTSGRSTCNHCAGWFRRPVHRKSPLFNFELGCFAHNYRPMLFLQQILNEMLRCMQTEGAPASEPPYGGTLLYNNKNTEPLNLQYFPIMVQTPSNCFHCRMVDTDQSQIMKTVMHIVSRWQLIFHSNEAEKSLVSFRWATLDALLIVLPTYTYP